MAGNSVAKVDYRLGPSITLMVSFLASSNRRTTISHFVVLQMCWELRLTASENKVRPAARSTSSTEYTWVYGEEDHMENLLGLTKLVSSASSDIEALGRMNAPVDISTWVGLYEVGLEARTTLAKWVGTLIFGGVPITSWLCYYRLLESGRSNERETHDAPFTILFLFR